MDWMKCNILVLFFKYMYNDVNISLIQIKRNDIHTIVDTLNIYINYKTNLI